MIAGPRHRTYGGRCRRVRATTDQLVGRALFRLPCSKVATTWKSGLGSSPGGSPTRTQVPRYRVMPMPCLNAASAGAVIRTP